MAIGRRSWPKRILVGLGAFLVVLALTVGGGVTWAFTSRDVSTIGAVDFTEELTVPPLADSRVEADGTRVFQLEMRTGQREFRPGQVTETWGFNGDYLGPTLRAKRGEKVRVQVNNRLDEASSVHWHGMHVPAVMDGGPHQPVDAGGTWTPEWTVDQPAATLWYHPHPHGATESHVRRGLAGMFLLDDTATEGLALPSAYGVDDLPIIVQDVRFRGSGFDSSRAIFSDTGALGDRTMVNGVLAPYRTVGDELVRLRLLNASTARTYNFGFSDDRSFALIGTDGGLLRAPAELTGIQLSPGERAEIVVRMRAGERVVLRSNKIEIGMDFWGTRFNGGDDTFDLLELRAAQTLRPSPALPALLAEPETAQARDAVRERTFALTFARINGREMDMGRIDETVTRGETELWTVRNSDGMPHNFHIHDVQFAVAEVNGQPPSVALSGAKDTVFLPPGTEMKVAVRFDGPADPNTPYMFHCHLLWHEDAGMMGQFVVVEPGGLPRLSVPHAHG
ncbi:multicopper oxidase domain-containing protein [Nocardia sp. 2]|uniref:Multicopper oxidase domain-containing protein n=1 Tax=Nocardia acididurans TaxID=2802282 RepID=A0ABS1MCV2_9NOCA|nr:multicopper oxidase domain-containing protein [Nocardia acididurans]MBL1078079.1 multicopper oxidase domain-containing protein [Nocardia acididurans]